MRGVGTLLVAFAFAFAFVLGCSGEDPPTPEDELRTLFDAISDTPAYVSTTPSGRLRAANITVPLPAGMSTEVGARQFLRDHGLLLGVADPDRDLQVGGSVPFGDGGELVIFWLKRAGVRLFGAGVRILVVDGAVRLVTARVPQGYGIDPTPRLEEAAIAERTSALFGVAMSLPRSPELRVFDRWLLARGADTGEGGSPVVAWMVHVPAADAFGSLRAFFSAADGELLHLDRRTRAARDRRVYDAQLGGDYRDAYTTSVQWFDEAGVAAGVTPGADQAWFDAQDAHDHANALYNYWFNTAGRDSYDDAGSPIAIYVNLNDAGTAGNAFWDERATYAAGSPGGAIFVDLGMMGRDLIAHEYTHAVLDWATRSAPLAAYESGAVEESICDVFGAVLDSPAPWTLGEETVAGVVKRMDDPPMSAPAQTPCVAEKSAADVQGSCAADPTTCGEGYGCIEGSCVYDWGNIHIDSGIGNRAFHLMTEGSAGAPTPPATCELHPTTGLGMSKTSAFYVLATALVDEHVSWTDLRAYVLAACFYMAEEGTTPTGASGPVVRQDCSSVMNAFASVGVGFPDRDGDAWNDEQDDCPDDFDLENDPAVCTDSGGDGSYCRHDGDSVYGGRAFCSFIPGPRPDWLEPECLGGDVGDGSCPGADDAMACIDQTPTDGAFTKYVYYGLDVTAQAEASSSCTGRGDRWESPYRP